MTKTCPNCRHACYHLAPTCEVCGWDFTEDQSPRLRYERQRPATANNPSAAATPEASSVQGQGSKAKLYHGDCLDLLDDFAENSIHALVTDPPAGIAFMGKEWDKDKGGKRQWVRWLSSVLQQCLHVLKPGAHALVWAHPRTAHWTMEALDDAGFEIRDVITHIQAQGFPKGQDVSKAIDRHLGAGPKLRTAGHRSATRPNVPDQSRGKAYRLGADASVTEPTTEPEQAQRWEGWKTALKPACEFWILARKPLSEGSVAENVLKWGVGGLNIDGCRLDSGRYPANLIHDGSSEVLAEFAKHPKSKSSSGLRRREGHVIGNGLTHNPQVSSRDCYEGYDDEGTIARFFWCPKPSSREKNVGCAGLPAKTPEEMTGRKKGSAGLTMAGGKANPYAGTTGKARANHHPTVKPLELMRYLCRLVTPPGGVVLDCFMGSGSTGIAALQEGFDFIGMEQDEEYFQIAQARLQTPLDGERRANHA